MGMAVTSAQNKAAVDAAVAAVMDRFGGTGIEATIYDVWILLFRSYGKCFSGSKYTG